MINKIHQIVKLFVVNSSFTKKIVPVLTRQEMTIIGLKNVVRIAINKRVIYVHLKSHATYFHHFLVMFFPQA